MSKQPPPAPTASAIGPCPTIIQISKTPRHWKFTQHHRTTRPPPQDWTSATHFLSLPLSLSLSLCENNKQFGFTLMSRRFIKTTLWHQLRKQNKLKRKVKEKCKKEKKGEKRHCLFSLLTEEIVELSYEHRCKGWPYSIDVQTMLFNRFGHSKKTLQMPHSKIRSISIIPYFKLLNILGFIRNGKTKQIKEIAEIHVMCDMTWISPLHPALPPPSPATIPTATTLWDTFILTFFLGRNFICSHCTNDKWDMGIMEAHPKAFSSPDCS